MIITLHGAGGEVTGSAYHLRTSRANVLVDFGFFQGVTMAERRNRVPRELPVRHLDAVLLTHAHLDHTGRLPLLAKTRFQAPIFATPASIDLAGLILRDAAKIQATDNERLNRKRQRAGQSPLEPLFDLGHVEAVLSRMQPVPYNDPVEVAPGVRARYVEAGHMLGSTSIHLTVDDDGRERTVVFSGDLGPQGVPILRDFEPVCRADMVFLESTYGDHNHRPFTDTIEEFEGIVRRAAENGGKILVPTFAVGRAQVLLYCLGGLFRSGAIPRFPVYLDSPMAIEATRIYGQHPELFDAEAKALEARRALATDLAEVHFSATADESRALNDVTGPCLIMAGAGMCNAGRILHHLKQNLWHPETWVLIVGYQGHGSLGRRLVDGADRVSIFGEKIAVKAQVRTLGGFSAHAGQADLLEWFSCVAPARPKVVLTHGEPGPRAALAQCLHDRFQLDAIQPRTGETVEL